MTLTRATPRKKKAQIITDEERAAFRAALALINDANINRTTLASRLGIGRSTVCQWYCDNAISEKPRIRNLVLEIARSLQGGQG